MVSFFFFFLRWFLDASVIIGVLGYWELCSRHSANYLHALPHIILRISLRGMCFECPHSLYRLGKPMLRDVEPCSASPSSECWGRNSGSCSFHGRACALSHVDTMPSQPGRHLQIFFFILSAVFSAFWVEECFHNSGGRFLCFSSINVDSVSPCQEGQLSWVPFSVRLMAESMILLAFPPEHGLVKGGLVRPSGL